MQLHEPARDGSTTRPIHDIFHVGPRRLGMSLIALVLMAGICSDALAERRRGLAKHRAHRSTCIEQARRGANCQHGAKAQVQTDLAANENQLAAATKDETAEAAPADDGWRSLFDGRTLGKWEESDFGGGENVKIEEGQLILAVGGDMTGVTWTGDLPSIDYEVSLEAKRVDGGDFFCGLTFPVGDSPCTLIVGGWGGTVVGLSSIDSYDAVENETTQFKNFERGQWYRIRLRVTKEKIEAWIDDEQLVDFEIGDHRLSVRFEVDPSLPFGIASWRTTAALRDIRMRKLDEGDAGE